MRRTKKAAGEAPARSVKFARVDAWNGLTPGDPVRISGIRGGRWRYRCHVTNVSSGATWVEVAELDVPRRGAGALRLPGEDGADWTPAVRRVRSFAEDRVLPLRRRRRRGAGSPTDQGVLDLDLDVPARPDRPEVARTTSPARRRAVAPSPEVGVALRLWAVDDDVPPAPGALPAHS